MPGPYLNFFSTDGRTPRMRNNDHLFGWDLVGQLYSGSFPFNSRFKSRNVSKEFSFYICTVVVCSIYLWPQKDRLPYQLFCCTRAVLYLCFLIQHFIKKNLKNTIKLSALHTKQMSYEDAERLNSSNFVTHFDFLLIDMSSKWVANKQKVKVGHKISANTHKVGRVPRWRLVYFQYSEENLDHNNVRGWHGECRITVPFLAADIT